MTGVYRSTWNETVCVWKLMCCNVRRDLDTWRLGRLLRMSSWMTYTSKILTPRRVPIKLWNRQLKWHRHLHLWSSIKELHPLLRELGAPICGMSWNTNRSQPRRRKSIWRPEEGVGGGYRTGDSKDPPWSSPAFKSRTTTSHGEPRGVSSVSWVAGKMTLLFFCARRENNSMRLSSILHS